ncbi:hypothetical protein ACEPAG_5951 [Sanghuangporus baumii]
MKMHSSLLLQFLVFCLSFVVSATFASREVLRRPAKRSYLTHDYFVLEHDPILGVSIEECADTLGAELIEPAGELRDHWLLRVQKERTLDELAFSKRSILSKSVRTLTRQVPRQRVKRAAIPAPPPTSSKESDEKSLARNIAQRLGIEDPLFKDQWHLVNEDFPQHMMNATPVWEMGITGKDVISCMVDDGLDFESDDLADNFDVEGSHDFNDHVDLPKPILHDDTHGTRCAGQIAAVKNGVCGVGIAYDSKVAGVRILSGPISDVDEASALNYGYQSTSIYSCSWGPPDDGKSMEVPSLLVQKAMLNGVQNGRGGKGAVYVFASGNGAHSGDQCNFDGYTNSIYSVTVASIDYKGQHPYYSESCAANMVTTYSSGSDRNRHIVTTDVGKDKCTKNHGGTSAAAPNAVGVFALALSVRPDLTWRDIQHLCVQTAQIVNPGDSSWELTATGRPYSYKFGFGKLDAYDFVTAAEQWTSVKPQAWIEPPAVQLANGTADANGRFSGGVAIKEGGVQSTIEVTQDMLAESNFDALEHVTVRVWIDHTKRGDVEISLLSPNGIRSMLAEKRTRDRDKDGFPGWRFMSVKHWGENPVGTWTLNVSDQNDGDEHGSLIGWKLQFWGSAKDDSRAVPYALKSYEELPIPFPLPEDDEEPIPDVPHTTAEPSTTKFIPKPTLFSSLSASENAVETSAAEASASPTLNSTPVSNGSNMSDKTRRKLAIAGLISGAVLICGAAFIIIRQIRNNRLESERRREEGEGDGEEVHMRLLDSEAQPSVAMDERRNSEPIGSSHIGFHSGFLDDEAPEPAQSRRYSDADPREDFPRVSCSTSIMSPPGEKLNELEKTLPVDSKISDGLASRARGLSLRRPRLRVRLIVFITTAFCLWIWVLHRRRLDAVPTRLPQDDSYISWPLSVAESGKIFEEELEEKPHRPPHQHKRPIFLNGKIAENIFIDVPNNESAITTSRHFTAKPHMAGTEGDYDTAIDFLHLVQKELGIASPLKDPVFSAGSPESRKATLGITERGLPSAWVDIYYPVLNSPVNHSLEILDNNGDAFWTAHLEEEAENELDPDAGKYAEAVPAFHGLSRGGEVQGKLVFVNYGRKEDYDELEAAGVDFNGTIVIARYGGIFRGLKVKGAQERGAVGCLIYSDPRDDGSVRYQNGYAAYPYGPARNPTSVQRGSVQFISLYPGDPTTPGYPSYENSTRTDGENIPKIPSLPISWNTASRLLQEIETGGQNRTIKLVNNVDDKVTPIWNTMAVIPGHIKNEVIVVGNHRDAWVLGATDPTSGTVSTYELIRGLGVLLKKGWRPLRTIVIASWDAEEYGLIGSTEWGEDFADWIDENVVAYFNLDSSVSGSRFSLSASPSLAHLVSGAARDIPHPTEPGKTLWQARFDSGPLHGLVDEEAMRVWEEQWGEPFVESADLDASDSLRIAIKGGSKVNRHGVVANSASSGVSALGSGSDYTVFLQRIGVASANGGFGSTLSDPVYHYHSVFDSQTWQERFGDPGFYRHVAVAKHLGLVLLRTADAIVLPINTTHYTYELDLYLDKVEGLANQSGLSTDFSSLRSSISKLQKSSVTLDEEKAAAEKHLTKLLRKWLHGRYGHGKGWVRKVHKALKKICSKLGLCSNSCERGAFKLGHPENLGASHRLKPRIGRFPEWVKEQKEKGHDSTWGHKYHGHFGHKNAKLLKKIQAAAKRVQAANKKLVAFERGFISEDGIKDREWFKHLGVAPGKWLGYGATTFPGLTEALVYDKNATLAQEEAKRLQALIDALAEELKV